MRKKTLSQQTKYIKTLKTSVEVSMHYIEICNQEYFYNYCPSKHNCVDILTSPFEHENVTIRVGNTNCTLLLDSGIGCSIVNWLLAQDSRTPKFCGYTRRFQISDRMHYFRQIG